MHSVTTSGITRGKRGAYDDCVCWNIRANSIRPCDSDKPDDRTSQESWKSRCDPAMIVMTRETNGLDERDGSIAALNVVTLD
jgi:hypothetical protein